MEESSEVLVSEGGTIIPVHDVLTPDGARPYFGWGTPEPIDTPILREHVRPGLEHWWEEHEEMLRGDWALENKTLAQVAACPVVRVPQCVEPTPPSQKAFQRGRVAHSHVVHGVCYALTLAPSFEADDIH